MSRSSRSLRLLLLPLLAAGVLAGCGGDDGDTEAQPASASKPLSGEAAVRIHNFEFKPKKITVKPGTKVTWTNEDTQIHDVKDTSPLGVAGSPPLNKGGTFDITYGQPGSYSYICGIHPYMTGTVEVVS